MHLEQYVHEQIDDTAKEAILELWNTEYPVLLQLSGKEALDQYFAGLAPRLHLLLKNEAGKIKGWFFLFERTGETWFAMILAADVQGKGYGRHMLEQAGALAPLFNGWAMDKAIYPKADGSIYQSPLPFYRKLGFVILPEKPELPFSAVKIQWRR